MFGISTSKNSRNGFHICHSLAFRSLCSFFNIGLNCLLLLWSCYFGNQFVLWGQGHKSNSENGIGSCSKYRNGCWLLVVGCWHYIKRNHRSHRFSNPVSLTFLDAFAPIDIVQPLQQSFSISRNSHAPLGHFFSNNRKTTTLRNTIHNFVVGQYGS